MDMTFIILILCGAATFGVMLVVAIGVFSLLLRRSGNAPNSSELQYLREEVARLHNEIERLRKDFEQSKKGSTAIVER
jgi:hypothetical protein